MIKYWFEVDSPGVWFYTETGKAGIPGFSKDPTPLLDVQSSFTTKSWKKAQMLIDNLLLIYNTANLQLWIRFRNKNYLIFYLIFDLEYFIKE